MPGKRSTTEHIPSPLHLFITQVAQQRRASFIGVTPSLWLRPGEEAKLPLLEVCLTLGIFILSRDPG